MFCPNPGLTEQVMQTTEPTLSEIAYLNPAPTGFIIGLLIQLASFLRVTVGTIWGPLLLRVLQGLVIILVMKEVI